MGTPLPEQFHSTLATRSPLPSARDPTRVVGMPLNAERASQHARTCRLSEMEKLIARVDKLERTLRELSARLDATARKRRSTRPGAAGMWARSINAAPKFTLARGQR